LLRGNETHLNLADFISLTSRTEQPAFSREAPRVAAKHWRNDMGRKILTFASVSLCCLTFPLPVSASEHWGYEGEFSPENWHKADPSFFMCEKGKNQTPINIVPQYTTNLPALEIAYPVKAEAFLNNGHTLQAQFPAGNSIRVGDETFSLVQLHFHAPSENHLNGKSFPLEAHFVHQDKNGNPVVMAVFFEEGKINEGLEALWRNMPRQVNTSVSLSPGFDANGILPSDKSYIYFNGSLTTPPCSEGVRWYVLRTPGRVAKSQTVAFTEILGRPNNRPLQPVNARPVLQ
jgi:carbonic anhydrase